jgi:anaphase-promoting complex subunit 1
MRPNSVIGGGSLESNNKFNGRNTGLTAGNNNLAPTTATGTSTSSNNEADTIASDGLKEVERESLLRFPDDDRVHEVCRMLKSSKPCYLKLERSPESSEIEHRQKQQIRLLIVCRRTLACCVGRGMLTISSVEPLMAEALPIPPLSLSGRVPPNNSNVALDGASTQPDLKLWPEFHNGVAAALRIGPSDNVRHVSDASDSSISAGSSSSTGARKGRGSGGGGGAKVTRNWIIYNKTASQQAKMQQAAAAAANNATNNAAANDSGAGESAHAGFLLGLGLFGHLNVLTITDICDYLTQGHEPTTIAVLIGIAASKMSSADALISKTLCLHLPTLLPVQHWDIEISPMTQSAALVGLGFLYAQSGHRLIVQFLLEELSRKPTSDRCECREALALSAAWALAMVLLPKKIPPKQHQNLHSDESFTEGKRLSLISTLP